MHEIYHDLKNFFFYVQDAIKLQKVMQHKVKELLDFDQESESDTDSDNSPIIKKDTSPIAKKRGRKSAAFIRGKLT